jgi:hypothetical protein
MVPVYTLRDHEERVLRTGRPTWNWDHNRWMHIFRCPSCDLVSTVGSPRNQLCGRCGYEGNWEPHVARWIDEHRWWNPRTWGSGHWELKKASRLSQAIWDEARTGRLSAEDRGPYPYDEHRAGRPHPVVPPPHRPHDATNKRVKCGRSCCSGHMPPPPPEGPPNVEVPESQLRAELRRKWWETIRSTHWPWVDNP